MLDGGLAHAFQTVILDQFDNPAKAGSHVAGKRFDLLRDPIIQQLDRPPHQMSGLLQKCNGHNRYEE
jgi:hypothetical protein